MGAESHSDSQPELEKPPSTPEIPGTFSAANPPKQVFDKSS